MQINFEKFVYLQIFLYLCTRKMTKKLSDIWKSPSVRNVGKLLSANVFAQAVGLLVYPVLTRLYSPEDFGLFALFSSLASTIALIGTANYQNAIILPKSDKHAIGIFHVGLGCIIATTLFVILTIPFGSKIANLFNEPRLTSWYWELPIYVFVLGLWSLITNWYIRKKHFSGTATYQISQSFTNIAGKIGFGYYHPSAGGLISASVIGTTLSLLLNILHNWKKSLSHLLRIDSATTVSVAKEYRNFPLYSLPQTLINQISCQMPVWLLLPAFGAVYIGWWNMALMLAVTPLSFISKALYQVFYASMTEKVHQKTSFRKFYHQFIGGSYLLILPLFTILWFILPSLTEWLLGNEWRITGEYIRWLLPWLSVNLLNSSVGFIPDIFFRQRAVLVFEIVQFILRTSTVIIAIITKNFMWGVIGYAMSSCVIGIAQLIWYDRLIAQYERSLQTNS